MKSKLIDWLKENAEPGEYLIMTNMKNYAGSCTAFISKEKSQVIKTDDEDIFLHYDDTLVALPAYTKIPISMLNKAYPPKIVAHATVEERPKWEDIVGEDVTLLNRSAPQIRLLVARRDNDPTVHLVNTTTGELYESYSAIDKVHRSIWGLA